MTKAKKLNNHQTNILFVTSTMPNSETDPVPAFVKDEAIWLKKLYPHLNITVLAPHNAYSKTKSHVEHQYYNEYRFHYFWPFGIEKVAGRGIQPAIKKNKLLIVQLPFLVIFEFFAIWRQVKKQDIQLIYAHWFTPQAITGALVSKITGVPMVFDTQASDVIVLKWLPFGKRLVGSVCKRAVAYTAPSQQTADKLLHFATPKNRDMMLSKLHMIPMGTAEVKPAAKAVAEVKEKYNLGGKKVLLFIGRLVDRKGVDSLIEAFEPLVKQQPSLRLVIAGDGQHRAVLEGLVKKLKLTKSVIFTGYTMGDDKYALLDLAAILVLPSINVGDQAEGLPITFMEGLAANKVTVISDATGAHETVNSGVNSFVFEAGSVPQLKDNLLRALKVYDTKDKKFYKAVEQLAKKFNWTTIAKQRYEAFKIDKL